MPKLKEFKIEIDEGEAAVEVSLVLKKLPSGEFNALWDKMKGEDNVHRAMAKFVRGHVFRTEPQRDAQILVDAMDPNDIGLIFDQISKEWYSPLLRQASANSSTGSS